MPACVTPRSALKERAGFVFRRESLENLRERGILSDTESLARVPPFPSTRRGGGGSPKCPGLSRADPSAL